MSFRRPCAEPGCSAMVTGTRCEAHARKTRKAYDARRGSTTERGYGANWRKVRRWYLSRHPNCERCLAEKTMEPAALVHHRDRNPFNNSESNLEALCHRHHEIEHAAERR